MVLPYNSNVPQGPQTISSSQAPILQNFQSIDSAFNETSGNAFTKYHLQAPLATDPVTAVNTGAVFLKTSNTKTELFYERDTGTAGAPSIPLSHLSMIRAWGSFVGTGAGPFPTVIPVTNGLNITSVTKTSTTNFNVVLASNAVISSNFGILCSCEAGGTNRTVSYSNIAFAAPVGSFSLIITSNIAGTISFMVFQL